MNKYSSLIWGGLVTLAAIVVIVWIMRESQETVNATLSNVQVSPDEEHGETLNGLSPLNALVDVAQTNLTYNVPQPGNVAPVNDSNQDSLTMGQAFALGGASADDSIENLLSVNLPASDFVN